MIRLSWCRWSLLGLLVLQLAWFGWLAPAETLGRSGGLLLAVVPLLLPLWPILRLNLDGLVIGGLLLLIYFCFAVVEAWISTGPMVRVLALLEIALIVLYYLALLSVRRRRSGAARSD